MVKGGKVSQWARKQSKLGTQKESRLEVWIRVSQL